MSEIPSPEVGEFDLPKAHEPTEEEMLARYNQSKADAHDSRQEQIKDAFAADESKETEAA